MILSNSDSPVTWRLNELLQAGKRAKAFATSPIQKSLSEIDKIKFSPTSFGSISSDVSEASELESSFSENETETGVQESEIEEEEAVDLSAKGGDEIINVTVDVEKLIEESEIYTSKIRKAREEGVEEGLTKGLERAKSDWDESTRLLREFIEELVSQSDDKSHYFDPLKKLSIHIAKHLVRGELTISGLAIERLVHEALTFIEKNSKGVVVVYLNKNDLERYKQFSSIDERLELRVDSELSLGSLRLSFDDSAIEDLIENRLTTLSELILDQSDGWKMQENNTVEESIPEVVEGELLVSDGLGEELTSDERTGVTSSKEVINAESFEDTDLLAEADVKTEEGDLEADRKTDDK